MKVLALGGAGAVGSAALRVAVTLPGIDEIVVADRDREAAVRTADELGGSVPARGIAVDITDEVGLRRALAEADLVVNTVGPYFRFGSAVVAAAIGTGTHYLDVCDDTEPTARMLELDGAARERGVCAVVGMGASPGVSNLLAAVAAAELDAVQDVHTAWPVDVGGGDPTRQRAQLLDADGGVSAAAVHWMQQAAGVIDVVADGAMVERPPLSPVALSLPGGRRGTAYTIGHPEPLTLRRSLRPRGDSASLMVVTRSTLAYLRVLRDDMDRGSLTSESAARALVRPRPWNLLRSLPKALRAQGPGDLPPFFAVATGVAAGRPRTVLAFLDRVGPGDDPVADLLHDMPRATGIPLALGLSQVVAGLAREPGVHPPESVIDSTAFFAAAARVLGLDADRPLCRIERA
ncbi:saccharopine dehydrogenase family protein [Nocardia takedensis]|uniref:saccharopine dehydrogenase family protein n=1 Tax=Nocardia takedensis TaxID=259390 RepID=UPI0002FC87F3|nr:saccharopine dehydrogenase NADP-binding domain-containing protein [Nocardia takedensis]